MELTDGQVQDLIAHITGTCMSLDAACAQLFDCDSTVLTQVQHLDIDAEIFECETCGWWFELFEQGEDANSQVCESCADVV